MRKFPGYPVKLCFVLIVLACTGKSYAQIYQLDRSTLEELSEDRKEENAEFYQFISNSTNYISLALPVSLFVTGVIKKDKSLKRNALIAGESILVSSVFTYALKNTVKRQRPFSADSLIVRAGHGGGYSFPSGHTAEAFSLATSLSLSYPKWYVVVPAYLWAGTVAYSRMYLGVHYPTDIVAGALVGGGSAFLTYKLNEWLMAKYSTKKISTISY